MSVKRRLLWSLVLAVALTAASLLYRTGSANYEPMPYVGVGQNIPPGVVACPIEVCRPEALSSRGWPLQIVAVTPNDDGSNGLYKDVLVVALLGDLALYFAISFVGLTIYSRLRKPTTAAKKPRP